MHAFFVIWFLLLISLLELPFPGCCRVSAHGSWSEGAPGSRGSEVSSKEADQVSRSGTRFVERGELETISKSFPGT